MKPIEDKAESLCETSSDCVKDSEDDCSSMQDVGNSNWQKADYFESKFQEYMFVASCMLAQMLNQSGSTQCLSTMNTLTNAFKSDSHKTSWLFASFPLVSGSFILISGRLGDIYGLKKMLIAGYIIMIIWTIICGLASYSHNDDFFIVCRALQGLGISFILPNVLGLVGNIYKVGTLRKNIVIAMIGAMAPLGACMGAFWAGLTVVQNTKYWPWAFYAHGLTAFINLLMSIYSIPNTVPVNTNNFKMDWIGSFLAVSGLILFNFVWNQAPLVGWNQGYIIAILIISTLLLISFFVFEVKWAKSPLLPPEVTKSRRIPMILTALFMGWGSFGIWTFYYFSFQLNLRHYTPVWAGGTYFVFAIFGMIAAFFVGLTIKRLGPEVLLCFSMMAFTVGSIMLSVTPVRQCFWRMTMGMQIILSFGMDLSFPASTIILSDNLSMQYQGMAGSLVNTIVNYSMSLCLGMGTTVETQIKKYNSSVLKGYRSAVYLGIGLGSLGVLISIILLVDSRLSAKKSRYPQQLESECP